MISVVCMESVVSMMSMVSVMSSGTSSSTPRYGASIEDSRRCSDRKWIDNDCA